MCGRYTIFKVGDIQEHYRFEFDDDFKPNYNAAPGQNLPVVTADEKNNKHIGLMRWGMIPVWAKDSKIGYKMINARAETIFEKPTWKRPAKSKRCLIPANGFYEWQKSDDGKKPFFIHPKDQELFSFAGLFDHWTDKSTGVVIESYTIITTTPNKEMEPIHDRMPVILSPEDEDRWIDPANTTPESIADLLAPADDNSLEIFEVGNEVGSVKNNFEKLITPI